MTRFRALLGLALFIGFVGGASAAEEAMRLNHRGLLLVALKPNPAVRYDTALLEAGPAIEALKTAIDLLYAKSPGSVAAIETLKANGNVLLVYEPAFPDAKMISANRVAAFFPDFYRKDGTAKDFLVQVGRHGIKWPADELAGIIVHELVGHGIQHLKGRLEGVREIDLECEAELYREQAHQDLNVDKTSPVMVRFRRALENQWCPDFRRYLVKENAALVPQWDQRNPDIKQLLAAFEPYVGALLASGVAGNAIAAARRIQDADFDKNVRKPAEDGSAAAQNNLGIRYRDGVGVERDLAESLKWFRRAADQGHAQGQFNLGGLYWDGRGVAKNPVEAATWWRKAADQGLAEAQFNIGIAHERGEGATKDLAEAAKWYAKAAAQGYTFAQVKFGEALGTARGIPQDLEKAYFWLTIASQRDAGDLKARALSVRDQITRVLPPARIAAIEASAKAWRPGVTN